MGEGGGDGVGGYSVNVVVFYKLIKHINMNKSINKTKLVASLFALSYISSCQHGQIAHEMQPAGKKQVYDAGKKNDSEITLDQLSKFLLDPKDLKIAKDSDGEDDLLGEGGYAKVYKGYLKGQEIAIKRPSIDPKKIVKE